ncbi:hypothetical protein B296_00043319 [Ensete ventricosum]|uniref:Uncharacterized protein n=1 Tax=Ensete ventricosum TaxID=4639 RepID=A0A426ZF50_ENSVE|nr:hypothetical protein B296_00043319 [Ensete ventricosum]
MENMLQETLNKFKRSLLKIFNKFQEDEGSNIIVNRFGDTRKINKGQDTSYPHMKVEFPK